MTDDIAPITIEVPTASDWDAIYRVISEAFHEVPTEELSAAEAGIYEIERSLVGRRDGEIVGTAAILTRQLAVPGAVIPAAHVSMVAVASTARRQGLLTRLMRQQFANARAAGEPVAVLWATEGRIYQRFGYGLAAGKFSLHVDSREVDWVQPVPAKGRLRQAAPAAVRDSLVALHDRAYTTRPGWSQRPTRFWDYRLLDTEPWRRGGTELRALLYETSELEGYALWRAFHKWTDGGPASEVRVLEVVTTTPEAYTAIWRHLLTMDLTRRVDAWACAPDEPLLAAVTEPRRLEARYSDALWLRVLDVPAALSARRYRTEVSTVLDITDGLIGDNAGRWRLTGSPTGAACTSTVDEPELVLDIRALGAAYLGGTSLHSLAATGLVTERVPGALDRVGTAFGWHRAPSSQEVF